MDTLPENTDSIRKLEQEVAALKRRLAEQMADNRRMVNRCYALFEQIVSERKVGYTNGYAKGKLAGQQECSLSRINIGWLVGVDFFTYGDDALRRANELNARLTNESIKPRAVYVIED